MSVAAVRLFSVVVAPAVACCNASALADFIPISRHSIVTADTQRSGQPDVHSEQTLDTFGPFNGNVSSTGFGAHQVSSITASTASVTMSATGGVVFNPSPTGVITYSEFTFVFLLQVPGSYTLTGNAFVAAPWLVQLSGPSGTFNAPDGQFNLSGPLDPGQYTFRVIIGQVQSNGGDIDALLTVVPTPGAVTLMASSVFIGAARRRVRPRR